MQNDDRQPPRVLVADDEAAVCLTLTAALRDKGFDVRCAHDGDEAARLGAAGGFEAAVVDLWLPRVDGLTVLRRLRASWPDMPLFAISGGGPGLSLEAARLLAQVCGADQVMLKPFDDRVLAARVETSVQQARKTRRQAGE